MSLSRDARVFVAGVLGLLGGLLVSVSQNFDVVLGHAVVMPVIALVLLMACVGVFWSIKSMERAARITFVAVVVVLCILPLMLYIARMLW